MKRLAFVIIVLSTLPAAAQQSVSMLPPLVLEKADQEKLSAYLMEQPTKFSLPIIQFLNEVQQRQQVAARDAAEKAEKEKANAK